MLDAIFTRAQMARQASRRLREEAHALRLALNAHCKLSVIHIDESKTTHEETDKEIAYLF